MTAQSEADVVVVGAGPAGAAAALVAARRGLDVVLLERGPFPGAKNMYGGVVYGRILDTIIPQWWEEAPIQRWVTRRQTMMMTPTQAFTVDFRTDAWASPPYNGATAFRPEFDNWLAGKAVDAGARLVCSTTATGVLRDGDRVVGVRTDRGEGELRARVVVAADGVNSFLAKDAGLYRNADPHHFTVGVKETLALDPAVIDERFGVERTHGVDIEIIGCTGEIPGGGFLYTNAESVSVGVVLELPSLAKGDTRPEELIGRLKAHSAIAPLVAGAEMVEYSAHVIPEAGLAMMPELFADGMLVTGDAAAMCLAAGIWLEGVNFAIGSGIAAGETAADAVARGDAGAGALAGYRRRLEANFVLQDHQRLRGAPELVMGDAVQQRYPGLVCSVAERMFRVENPQPKPGLRRIVSSEAKRAGVSMRQLVKDALAGARTFG